MQSFSVISKNITTNHILPKTRFLSYISVANSMGPTNGLNTVVSKNY